MYKTKGLISGAVLLALVLIIGSIGIACAPKQTQAPTSPPPIIEPETVPSTTPQLPEETPVPPPVSTEPEIPADYTTYTDESGLFSISYPSDWETALSEMPEIERKAKESISKLKIGSVEEASIIFYAGLRTATGGHDPAVNIVVGPVPAGISTYDQWVEAEINGLKKSVQNYREYSRLKTTVDGRDATLLEYQATSQGGGPVTSHSLQMYTRIDKTGWVVTCGTSLISDAAKWSDDFNAVVRSLRISD